MVKSAPPSENLGSVPLNGGVSSTGKPYGGYTVNGKFVPHSTGELRREVDPTGKIVEHRVRKSTYVHEKLHNLTGPQKLADELYDAAENFRKDFERAQLTGSYARTDLFRTRAGQGEISDKVALAKIRISKALNDLGNGRDGESLSQSCVWNVVGLGATLESWTALIRRSGGSMYSDKAAGLLLSCLERLALHYGVIDRNRLNAMGQDKAYARAIHDFISFANVFAAGEQSGGKGVMGRFLAGAQKRFAKFA
jgi:hypothetical protein